MGKNVLIVSRVLKKVISLGYRLMAYFIRRIRTLKKRDFCPVCCSACCFLPLSSHYAKHFKKYGFLYSLDEFETLNHRKYTCSECGSTDRDRMIACYLSKYLPTTNKGNFSIIQFAPSRVLSHFIQDLQFSNYRTADLYMENVDDAGVDICDLNLYADHRFDCFICSHVLEHVDDDVKAMRELYRILKPGGFGIFLVPIVNQLKEDHQTLSVKTESERWKYFGQGDHVRLYDKAGLLSKLEKAGFLVEEIDTDKICKNQKYGIDAGSVLYILKKR